MLGNEGRGERKRERGSRQPHYAFIGRNRCPMGIFRMKLDGTSWTRWPIGTVSTQHVYYFCLISLFASLQRLPCPSTIVPPHLEFYVPFLDPVSPPPPSPRSDLNSSTSFKSIAFQLWLNPSGSFERFTLLREIVLDCSKLYHSSYGLSWSILCMELKLFDC